MKLKYFIPAVIGTIFIVGTQLLLPFAYDWYMAKLGWDTPPAGAIMVIVFVSMGVVAANIYLYVLAFDDK